MATRPEHFPRFDALRGIAALFVLTYHAMFQPAVNAQLAEVAAGTRTEIDAAWWRYAIHLDVAVPIFLAISGFLLYRPFVAARVDGRPLPSLRRYGIRRALRIVPGYWFALTAIALWFWAFPPGFEDVRDAGNALRYYGFLQVYDADTAIGGIGQAWTLCVEVTFYLALPLWILLARRFTLRTELIGLAAIVAVSIAWKAVVLGLVDPATRASLPALLPMPTWLDQFAVGMGLAALSVHHRTGPRLTWPFWIAAGLLFLGACWIAGPDGSPSEPVTDRIYLVRHLFYTAFVGCLLVPAIWGTSRVLLWRPIAYVGAISFSFYLWHLAWLRQEQRWFGTPGVDIGWGAWFAVAVAGSVVLGTVGFYLVERPFMRLGRRLRGRPRDARRA